MANRVETVKGAVKRALKDREAIRRGDFSPFIPALAMAVAKDGLLDFIPIVGNLLGLFISVYLFVFLWGKGKWKLRIIIFFLSLADIIPGISFLPFSTICVIYAFLRAKKRAGHAKIDLEAQNKLTNAERIREYQGRNKDRGAAARVSQSDARKPIYEENEQPRQEAANDPEYRKSRERKII